MARVENERRGCWLLGLWFRLSVSAAQKGYFFSGEGAGASPAGCSGKNV